MDKFSLFFAFYSLILGLAVTELLSGFGQFVRSHALHKIGAQTALLAFFTFLAITATSCERSELRPSSSICRSMSY